MNTIKTIILAVTCFFSAASLACTNAVPTNSANFCASFKDAATCYCTSSGVPSGLCQNMGQLYNRMMIMFGSLQRACEFQHYTSTQDCIDNWNCYMRGGVDSLGRACSSTQSACS